MGDAKDISREKVNLINEIIENIELQVSEFQNKKMSRETLGNFWCNRTEDGLKRMKNIDIFINFRRNNLLVVDLPYQPNSRKARLIFNLFMKFHRYMPFIHEYKVDFKLLYDAYDFIREQHLEDLLKANPLSLTGNPYAFEKDGLRFTRRWVRHIYFLSLYEKYLEPNKDEIKTIMDIGSSWGAFSHLVKKNHPDTRFILVDVPEQLALAHYYLKSEMPYCRIATPQDVQKTKKISSSFLKNYDFILVPCFDYEKIGSGIVDLVTNFVSFCEMSKEWFNLYTKSEAFKTAKFLFIWNSVIKEKNPGVQISILDYPLYDYGKIHFNISPLLWVHYKQRKKFNIIPAKAEMYYHEPFFEFIGRRRDSFKKDNL